MQTAVLTTSQHAPTLTNAGPMLVHTGPSTEPAYLIARGPLATRAHRLLGLGASGAAQLGAAQRSLADAFGGDLRTWHQLGTPWIAARSLARPTDSLPAQSSANWLLATRR